MSSWQHVNSPDDAEKRKLKGAIEEWQNTCEVMESKNATLRRRLLDQESFVEQLSSEQNKRSVRKSYFEKRTSLRHRLLNLRQSGVILFKIY